jgi:hypothetical protein
MRYPQELEQYKFPKLHKHKTVSEETINQVVDLLNCNFKIKGNKTTLFDRHEWTQVIKEGDINYSNLHLFTEKSLLQILMTSTSRTDSRSKYKCKESKRLDP